jgi:hypothetical protein
MPGILYSNDFEAETDSTPVSGFTTQAGAAMVAMLASGIGLTVAGGTKGFGRNSDGDSTLWTGVSAFADMAIRTAHKVPSVATSGFAVMCHNLRGQSGSNDGYRVVIQTNGTALRTSLVSYSGGSTTLASGAYDVAPSSSDIVQFESEVTTVGGQAVLKAWLWIGTGARPSTPHCTYTDTANFFPTGRPGVRNVSSNNWTLCDNLVITDATVAADTFYPASSTSVSSDLAVSYGIVASISSNLAVSYTIDAVGQVSSNLAASYGIVGSISSSLAASYSIAAPTATITFDDPASPGNPLDFGKNTASYYFDSAAVTVYFNLASTNALIATASLTTNADATLDAYANAAFASGTSYRCVFKFADGSEGMVTLAAA